MKNIVLLIAILFASNLFGQAVLSLDDCYNLLDKNYPLAQQKALLEKQNKIDLEVINKAYLPQFEVSVKATYQSDVTAVPIHIPGVNIPIPNKDQYRATLTANQLIYQGGLIETQTKAKILESEIKQSAVTISLYNLKQKVNLLYFSTLLQDEKKALILDKQKQLDSRLGEANSAVKNGVALASTSALLEAESLNVTQQLFEIKSTKSALLQTLSKLIGTTILPETIFEHPQISYQESDTLNRPELTYFNLQKKQISEQSNLLEKINYPRISAFAQGGYGNPGLNVFDTNFAGFYMVGVQLNWTVFDWQKNKKQRESLQINQQLIDTQQSTFKLNTNLETLNQLAEINTLTLLLKTNNQIISLREQVLKTAESQLKNGVITSSDYLTELTRLYEAKTNLKTNQIQLSWATINYLTTTGTYENNH